METLSTNYETHHGELPLVQRDGNVIVFWFPDGTTYHATQQYEARRAALDWLSHHRIGDDVSIRFDRGAERDAF